MREVSKHFLSLKKTELRATPLNKENWSEKDCRSVKVDPSVIPPAPSVHHRIVPADRKHAVSEESMFQKARQPTRGLQPTSVRLAQPDVLVF